MDTAKKTMSVLRIAFLSSAVLEFFSSISIALVAVYLGMSLWSHRSVSKPFPLEHRPELQPDGFQRVFKPLYLKNHAGGGDHFRTHHTRLPDMGIQSV